MTLDEQTRLEFLEEFRHSALERVDRVAATWLALEGNGADQEQAEDLLRELHSLKGEAKMMGFADVSLVAHRTEELLLTAMKRAFDVPSTYGDLVLAAVDTISHLVRKRAAPSDEVTDLSDLLDRFDGVLAEVGVDRRREFVRQEPERESGKPTAEVESPQYLQVTGGLAAQMSETASEVAIAHRRYEHGMRRIEELAEELGRALERVRDRSNDNGDAKSFERAVQLWSSLGREVDSVTELVHEGALQAGELEEQARRLRLVPIRGLLSRYTRPARELAREQGKSLTIDIDDQGMVLDHVLVDRMSKPLLHLVRNAIDHGIESPEERRRAGKPETARLVLSARREGGYVVLRIEDDGRGLDLERIRARGVEGGFVAEGEVLSESATIDLLFRTGFSTARETTETSGRGVGLDVVKRDLEQIGGGVRVRHEAGQGVAFDLHLPVSVALTRVLVVTVGDELYAVPSISVERTMMLNDVVEERIGEERLLRVPEGLIDLRRLGQVVEADATGEVRAIVVKNGDHRVAFAVSGWVGDLDVVVKSLGQPLSSCALFLGACVLRDGRVALVLNPPEVLSLERGQQPEEPPGAGAAKLPSILYAEDSAITRSVVANALRTLGYEVVEAENGARALELLVERDVQLILTDVDMPALDGIAFIRKVRNELKRQLPIIVLSTRELEADRSRAFSAGADAYLVKDHFSVDVIQRTLERYLGPGRE